MTDKTLALSSNPMSLAEELRLYASGPYEKLLNRAADRLDDLQLDHYAAVDFIRKVYEAVHCKPLIGDLVNLEKLAEETLSEIERWKVEAPPDETDG